MAVGSSTFNEVRTFLGNNGEFTRVEEKLSVSTNGGFGASVVVTELLGGSVMIVGAPLTASLEFGRDLPFGAVHFFRWQVNRWVLLGGPVFPGLGPGEVNGAFGETVAAAPGRLRFVAGAPGTSIVSSGSALAGRVYIYEYLNSEWTETFSFDGLVSNGGLGSALDMSENGSVVCAGAPNVDGGYVLCFSRQPNGAWVNSFFETGTRLQSSNGAEFGSSIAILSPAGDRVAIGAPSAFGGSGVIRVYELGQNGLFEQLGSDIVGDVGESLGRTGTLSGGNGIFFTVAGSLIRKFVYDGAEWVVSETINNGITVAALSTTAESNGLATIGMPSAVSVFLRT